jgi:hypothetical protein
MGTDKREAIEEYIGSHERQEGPEPGKTDLFRPQHKKDHEQQNGAEEGAYDLRSSDPAEAAQGRKEQMKEQLLVGIMVGQPAEGCPGKRPQDAVLGKEPADRA